MVCGPCGTNEPATQEPRTTRAVMASEIRKCFRNPPGDASWGRVKEISIPNRLSRRTDDDDRPVETARDVGDPLVGHDRVARAAGRRARGDLVQATLVVQS